ncbi:hypothetical protein GSI_02827 [Ganoderma sinense ZZ0214-1]|uniref:Uncharacterized protein n=1 Tax=Ganoderma sinense ZZ0214-1 TaxID=1077348 RepID=A0A2G8SMQ5_9APHY|nr:hypothetical protein GSI_02827 [Ganoderma sinense ZZ0214-1]
MSTRTSPFPAALDLEAIQAPLISATSPPDWASESDSSSIQSSPDIVHGARMACASSLIDPLDEIDLAALDDQHDNCVELRNGFLESPHRTVPQRSLLLQAHTRSESMDLRETCVPPFRDPTKRVNGHVDSRRPSTPQSSPLLEALTQPEARDVHQV